MTNKYQINIDNRYSIDKNGNVVFDENGEMNIFICWDRENYLVWLQFEHDGKMARTWEEKVFPEFQYNLEVLIHNFVDGFQRAVISCASNFEDFDKHATGRSLVKRSEEIASWVIRPIICDLMDKILKKYSF